MYERLVEAMVESVAPGKPEGHLLKEIETLEVGKMGVWPLREQLDWMYQTYLALCRRTRKAPLITKQIVVGIYLRYLPEELDAQVRDLAPNAELETLYIRQLSLLRLGKIAAPLTLCCGRRAAFLCRAGMRPDSS